MCESRSMERLAVETAAENGVWTVFPLKFRNAFCWNVFIVEISRNKKHTA
jgi:hypothetical protein